MSAFNSQSFVRWSCAAAANGIANRKQNILDACEGQQPLYEQSSHPRSTTEATSTEYQGSNSFERNQPIPTHHTMPFTASQIAEQLRGQVLPLSENDRSFDPVFQLADVSGPIVGMENLDNRG